MFGENTLSYIVNSVGVAISMADFSMADTLNTAGLIVSSVVLVLLLRRDKRESKWEPPKENKARIEQVQADMEVKCLLQHAQLQKVIEDGIKDALKPIQSSIDSLQNRLDGIFTMTLKK